MIEVFWPWVIARSGRKTGLKLLFTWWLLADFTISSALTFGLRINGFEFASKALFPAASILVSMAVAWTARAATIMNQDGFRDKVISEGNPIEDYVYGYQLSVGILFSCVIYIAIMAAGGFEFYIYDPYWSSVASSFFMYALISLTIRECWSVINFTNLLTILDSKVR